MWLKTLITIFLFYLLAVLQSSFFLHFNIMGIAPNFVLIFFFIIVFFSARGGPVLDWENLLYSVTAGFFLDVYSYSYFGISIVLLLAISILAKKIMQSLREKKDKYPIAYFAPLFLIFYVFYDVFSGLFVFFFDPAHIIFSFTWPLLIRILYNLTAAIFVFYICKGFVKLYKL